MAADGRAVAVAGLGDPLRPDAADALDRLRKLGWKIRILSGDHPEVVAAIGRRLGIEAADALGGASPEAKLAAVREALAGGPTIVIGDGGERRRSPGGRQRGLRRGPAQRVGRLDSQPRPDGRHRLGMIAGEYADLPTEFAQAVQRVGRVRPQRIAQPGHSDRPAVGGHEDRRSGRGDRLPLGTLDRFRNFTTVLPHKLRRTDDQAPAGHGSDDAAADRLLDIANGNVTIFCLRLALRQGLGDRMDRIFFQRRAERPQAFVAAPGHRRIGPAVACRSCPAGSRPAG